MIVCGSPRQSWVRYGMNAFRAFQIDGDVAGDTTVIVTLRTFAMDHVLCSRIS